MNKTDYSTLSGEDALRQAAIVLMAVGKKDAGRVLKYLQPKQVMRIGKSISGLGPVSVDHLNEALSGCNSDIQQLTDVGRDGHAYARQIMAFSKDKLAVAGSGFDHADTSALDDLKWLDAASVMDVISNEHPQVQAIVLAYLDADHAAEVLALIPDFIRQDVIVRIGSLSSIQTHALEELNAIVAQKLHASAGVQSAALNGSRLVADIFRHLDEELEVDLLKVMHRADQKLHDQVEEQLGGINRVLNLDEQQFDLLLTRIEPRQLVLVLKGADQQLYERIQERLPPLEFDQLENKVEKMGPVRLADIDAAQQQLIALSRL